MSNIVEFAKRMKAQREKHGLTQAQLGEKVGLSTQTISAYEKNVSGRGKTPTLDKAIAIADALGVSLDFLCGADPTERECEMGSLNVFFKYPDTFHATARSTFADYLKMKCSSETRGFRMTVGKMLRELWNLLLTMKYWQIFLK